MKIVISSVAEGDDKPKKYPLIFKVADVVLLNKIDLLEAFEFNPDRFWEDVLRINERAKTFGVSCKTGSGLPSWVEWQKESLRNL